MGAVLVPIIFVIVLVVLAAFAIKRFNRTEIEHSNRLQAVDRPTLSYKIPRGQDPAVVLTALKRAGYDASADSEPGPSSPIVIIGTRSGEPPDREAVRRTIEQLEQVNIDPRANVDLDLPPVRFTDE